MRAAAQDDPHRRTEHSLLHQVPALERLYPRLFAIVVLAVAFVALTIAITAGVFASLDHQVAEAMHSIWQESLHGLFQLIAELGGLELTTVLMVGLFFYLWRCGVRDHARGAVA